ncbi:MAG TPA: hypothetical protein PKN32_05055 [Bacteroidales bacterium]|nr:hypothetical protein [Bacteroidales bacterium]
MSERLIYTLLQSKQTVFSINEIALIGNFKETKNLKSQLNYYVKTNLLLNIRKGFYAKHNFSIEEIACKLYTPSYLSLDYVLQKEGIIFQYNSEITAVSYLSRKINLDFSNLKYRKIKYDVLLNTYGIIRQENGVNIATAERAVLDSLYFKKSGYFDNISALDMDLTKKMLAIYKSKALEKLFYKVF